jgi:hypothetical protein
VAVAEGYKAASDEARVVSLTARQL